MRLFLDRNTGARPPFAGAERRWFLVVSTILLVLLSGCTVLPLDNELTEEPQRLLKWRHNTKPFFINSTIDDGYFWFESPMVDSCVQDPNFLSYQLFDRYGNKEERLVYLPMKGNHTVRIDLFGESPHVFTGSYVRCAEFFEMRIYGFDGFRMGDHGLDLNRGWVEWNVSVEVPIGADRGETKVTLPEHAWNLRQAVPWTREGWNYGTISLYSYEYDYTERKDSVTIWRGWETLEWGGYHHVPGGFHVILELDHPAPIPTTWVYNIEYFVFNEEVCQFGLEWKMCK